jgi:hypothetical protein
MIPIPIAVGFVIISLFVGATLGCVITSLNVAAGNADDRARYADLMTALGGVIMNARYGLAQYPDARDGARVVEVPLTADECRAIVRLFDGEG